MALAALKYSFQKLTIGKNIVFNFDEALSFDGNSGVYLLYTVARINSILEKSDANDLKAGKYNSFNEDELILMRLLMQYESTVISAVSQHAPDLICKYLFDLGQLFNAFYQKVPVIKANDDEKCFRLTLIKE